MFYAQTQITQKSGKYSNPVKKVMYFPEMGCVRSPRTLYVYATGQMNQSINTQLTTCRMSVENETQTRKKNSYVTRKRYVDRNVMFKSSVILRGNEFQTKSLSEVCFVVLASVGVECGGTRGTCPRTFWSGVYSTPTFQIHGIIFDEKSSI